MVVVCHRRAYFGHVARSDPNRAVGSVHAHWRTADHHYTKAPAMKVLLIVNPSASSVTARTRIVIQKALSADHRLEVSATTRRGHATRLAQSAANDGIDVVVVLGGDGTLNEAANGLVGTDTALAALPGGSTNVFARTLGLPDDPVEATGALLDAIDVASIRRVGLGSVNDRHFLFHAGVGFDAAVVEQVERRGGLLKRFAGHPLYIAATIDTWVRHYDHRRPAFRVTFPESDHDGPDAGPGASSVFAAFLNTDPYTYLGTRGLSLAPAATLDGPLSVATFANLSVATLVTTMAAAMGLQSAIRSRSGKSGGLQVRDDVNLAEIVATRSVPWQVDGDHAGDADRLVVRHHPEAMDLVVPLASPAFT